MDIDRKESIVSRLSASLLPGKQSHKEIKKTHILYEIRDSTMDLKQTI